MNSDFEKGGRRKGDIVETIKRKVSVQVGNIRANKVRAQRLFIGDDFSQSTRIDGLSSFFPRARQPRGRRRYARSRGIVLSTAKEPVPVLSRCAKRQWRDLSGYGETRFNSCLEDDRLEGFPFSFLFYRRVVASRDLAGCTIFINPMRNKSRLIIDLNICGKRRFHCCRDKRSITLSENSHLITLDNNV